MTSSQLTAPTLQSLFFAGKHQAIVDAFVDGPALTHGDAGFAAQLETADFPYVIGGLAYVGRLAEAERLLESKRAAMPAESLAASLCYLSFGLCRNSHYKRASEILCELGKSMRRHPSLDVRFHVFMGLAFYRYFCCRYKSALWAVQRAYEAATQSQFMFGRFLSTDLLGHCLVLTGNVHEGLRVLQRAIDYAAHFGKGGFADATRVAIACYSAQFGIEPHASIARLEKLLNEESTQDTYTRSSLHLELARQWTLRGCIGLSQKALDSVCGQIYASGHRRYQTLLNLRYAHNLFLRGEFHQALNLIGNASEMIDKSIDRRLYLEILGQRQKLLSSLGLAHEVADLQAEIKALTHNTGGGVAVRILSRTTCAPTAYAVAQDPLGDIMDVAHARLESADERMACVLQHGYFGLLPTALGIPPQTCGIFFRHSGGSVLIVDRGDVIFQKSVVTRLLQKLIMILASVEHTKEYLASALWSQKYQSLRHDPLIYNLVSRARTLLGPVAHWIVTTENGYRIASHVKVESDAALLHVPQEPGDLPSSSLEFTPSQRQDLNFRQLEIVSNKGTTPFLDIQSCVQKFEVSRVTAMRDLKQLCEMGLLQRVGQGRATKYLYNEQPMNRRS